MLSGKPIITAIGALLIAAPFPLPALAAWEKYSHPWDLKFDPYVYGAGFADAIAIRLIRMETGKSYFEFRGDREGYVRTPRGQHLCAADEMPRAWLDNPRRCHLTMSKFSDDCRPIKGCLTLAMDPAVLKTYRTEIVEALQEPCRVFDDADALRRQLPRDQERRELWDQGPGDLTIASRWRLFRCRSRTPIRGTVDLSESDRGLLTVRF